jgi:hypothetical protein
MTHDMSANIDILRKIDELSEYMSGERSQVKTTDGREAISCPLTGRRTIVPVSRSLTACMRHIN